ncbi:hypothetical protein BD311DRAFT_769755 [Dichomitus squalens]|uniref:Uncharacterized protein n=1 Tax=Dichomitus squalens TaxID=114155 RepID=A0A4Q9M8Q7_9APHY|nr:hypothetical protein BD311DRAFT_769755 [Dichomitus squalens]
MHTTTGRMRCFLLCPVSRPSVAARPSHYDRFSLTSSCSTDERPRVPLAPLNNECHELHPRRARLPAAQSLLYKKAPRPSAQNHKPRTVRL